MDRAKFRRLRQRGPVGARAPPLQTLFSIASCGMRLVLGYIIFIYGKFRGRVALDEAS
jgi:hypothetical protein